MLLKIIYFYKSIKKKKIFETEHNFETKHILKNNLKKEEIINIISKKKYQKIILISTIDVYSVPTKVLNVNISNNINNTINNIFKS